jgi:hypothetical protein
MKTRINYGLAIFIFLFAMSFLASCSGENECFDCLLRDTSVMVCTDTFQEQAALNNLEVNSLEEYIDAISATGFQCEMIP